MVFFMKVSIEKWLSSICMILLSLCIFDIAFAEESPVEKKPKAFYTKLGDIFVVNLHHTSGISEDGLLQVKVEVMVRKEKDLEIVQSHIPYFRNDLILLFNSQTKKSLLNGVSRKKLYKQALNILNKRLSMLETDREEKVEVTRVLFTQMIVE